MSKERYPKQSKEKASLTEDKKFIKHLEDLEANTEVIVIEPENNREILEEYLNTSKEQSFNEFLESRFKNQYPGKIIVAEIRGFNFTDRDTQEDSDININGADFTGSKVSNVKMSSLKDVSFRDCHLENVTIENDCTNLDFRGATIEEWQSNVSFDLDMSEMAMRERIYSGKMLEEKDMPTIPAGLQFDFYDVEAVGDKGVYELYNKKEYDTYCAAYEEWEGEQRRKFISETLTWGEKAKAYVRGYDKDTLEKIEEWDKSAKVKKSKALQEFKTKQHRVYFENPKSDPTYTPNQSKEEAQEQRVYVAATKSLLADYKQTDRKKSFNEFVAEQYQTEGSDRYRGARLIADFANADLSGEDLSGLDLRGVNFAYCEMKGANCKGANLQGACLEGCEFDEHTTFESANLTDANMAIASGAKVDFSRAVMIRTRMQCTSFPEANMANAQMYAVNGFKADLTSAKMMEVDARRGKLKGAILQSVDARKAKMEMTHLEGAVLDDAKFAEADLRKAILTKAQAQGCDFTRSILEDVHAEMADFRKAMLQEVVAKGCILTGADLTEANARMADFTKAKLEGVNARMADFTLSVMEDVQAAKSNFTKASLEKVNAARIDLQGALLTEVNAKGADLTKAAMQEVDAYKAHFEKAKMEMANFDGANFTAADFEEAYLKKVIAKQAKFVATNFENAEVSDIEFDEETLLLDANLRGAKGAERMKELQKKQEEIKGVWFGKTRYGHCKSNSDGTNDRYTCQRLGAAILSTSLGGGTGLVLAGPFAGVSSAVIAAYISDKGLDAIKRGYYDDLGYINNSIGDRLAEIGAIAMSAGVNGVDRAIDGAAAGLVLGAAGAVTGTIATAAGIVTILGGGKLAWSGYKEQSLWKKAAGATIAAVGGALTFVGFSSLSTSVSMIGYGALYGGAMGAAYTVYTSARELYRYEEKDGKQISGLRPEQIYRSSIEQFKGIIRKIMPTTRKIVTALVLGAVAAGVAVFGVDIVIAAVGGALLSKASVGLSVVITAAAAGLVGGYLYDDKVMDASKFLSNKLLSKGDKQGDHNSAEGGVTPTKKKEEEKSVSKKTELQTQQALPQAKEEAKQVASSRPNQKPSEGKWAKRIREGERAGTGRSS